MAVKWYDDIKRCPFCGGITGKLGKEKIEFFCTEDDCGAMIMFPRGISPEEQIDRFNRRSGDRIQDTDSK